jgi:hypothetical protein
MPQTIRSNLIQFRVVRAGPPIPDRQGSSHESSYQRQRRPKSAFKEITCRFRANPSSQPIDVPKHLRVQEKILLRPQKIFIDIKKGMLERRFLCVLFDVCKKQAFLRKVSPMRVGILIPNRTAMAHPVGITLA